MFRTHRTATLIAAALMMLISGGAAADKFDDTLELFRNAGASNAFFAKSYGYAVFPTIGKAGFGIGGARGSGRVYANGEYVGDTTMTQLFLGVNPKYIREAPYVPTANLFPVVSAMSLGMDLPERAAA